MYLREADRNNINVIEFVNKVKFELLLLFRWYEMLFKYWCDRVKLLSTFNPMKCFVYVPFSMGYFRKVCM